MLAQRQLPLVGGGHRLGQPRVRPTDRRPSPTCSRRTTPLEACRPGHRDHGTVHVLGADAHDDLGRAHGDAEELRSREAVAAADAVVDGPRRGLAGRRRRRRRRCGRAGPGDITVLLPARTSLPALETALRERGIPYRAENSSVVYTTAEIRHLMLALRAADDPTDELALVAALRSPLYGCSDVELYEWVHGRRRWNIWRRAARRCSPTHPVAEAIAHVRSVADRISWRTPADLLAAIVDERRAARRRARQPRCPRRLAAGPLRDRPGPGVERRRRARGAALPARGRGCRRPRVASPTRSCPSTTTTRCGS